MTKQAVVVIESDGTGDLQWFDSAEEARTWAMGFHAGVNMHGGDTQVFLIPQDLPAMDERPSFQYGLPLTYREIAKRVFELDNRKWPGP